MPIYIAIARIKKGEEKVKAQDVKAQIDESVNKLKEALTAAGYQADITTHYPKEVVKKEKPLKVPKAPKVPKVKKVKEAKSEEVAVPEKTLEQLEAEKKAKALAASKAKEEQDEKTAREFLESKKKTLLEQYPSQVAVICLQEVIIAGNLDEANAIAKKEFDKTLPKIIWFIGEERTILFPAIYDSSVSAGEGTGKEV